MNYLYILYSERIVRYYTGHSNDLGDHFSRHNAGKSKTSQSGVPWQLKYRNKFKTRAEAMKAEKWIKRIKSCDILDIVVS